MIGEVSLWPVQYLRWATTHGRVEESLPTELGQRRDSEHKYSSRGRGILDASALVRHDLVLEPRACAVDGLAVVARQLTPLTLACHEIHACDNDVSTRNNGGGISDMVCCQEIGWAFARRLGCGRHPSNGGVTSDCRASVTVCACSPCARLSWHGHGNVATALLGDAGLKLCAVEGTGRALPQGARQVLLLLVVRYSQYLRGCKL